MKINCRGKILDLSIPKVMGIINVNADSFYAESRSLNVEDVMKKAFHFIEQGASIIDIGIMSSRPGAKLIETDVEIEILTPVIKKLNTINDIIISIDTVWAKTAAFALQNGASVINDISAGNIDENMMKTVASYEDVPYIMMHMKGTPETMISHAQYDDVLLEIIKYLSQKIYQARSLGIKDLIIDPGFGFAKTIEQNFELLSKLEYFEIFDLPMLVGLSRKSMIYKTLQIDVSEALNGTTVLNTIALMKGANILRVHDVKEAVEVVNLRQSLQ